MKVGVVFFVVYGFGVCCSWYWLMIVVDCEDWSFLVD